MHMREGEIVTGKQLDQLLSILDRAMKVAERWADREYPQIDEANQAEFGISRVGDNRPPQSLEEYRNFEPEEDRLAAFAKKISKA